MGLDFFACKSVTFASAPTISHFDGNCKHQEKLILPKEKKALFGRNSLCCHRYKKGQ